MGFWCFKNIATWTDCFRLVSYLPFERINDLVRVPTGGFSISTVTDLHLIMALVKVNEGSCNTIYCAMKTLGILHDDEIDKFLPVFSEVLVWSATEEEGVDDLVSKVVKPDAGGGK